MLVTLYSRPNQPVPATQLCCPLRHLKRGNVYYYAYEYNYTHGRTRIRSYFCVLNFMLPACRPNVEQACFTD